MTRYIKYTPTQNEFTTLDFVDNGTNDNLVIRWFDTHVVAVSGGDDSDFNQLLADQHPECLAIEIDFSEFYPLAFESRQAKFQIEQLEKNLAKTISQINQGASQNEMLTWTKQEQEARALLDDETAKTPLIDGLIVSRGLEETREELAQKIVGAADFTAIQIAKHLGEHQAAKRSIFQ